MALEEAWFLVKDFGQPLGVQQQQQSEPFDMNASGGGMASPEQDSGTASTAPQKNPQEEQAKIDTNVEKLRQLARNPKVAGLLGDHSEQIDDSAAWIQRLMHSLGHKSTWGDAHKLVNSSAEKAGKGVYELKNLLEGIKPYSLPTDVSSPHLTARPRDNVEPFAGGQ